MATTTLSRPDVKFPPETRRALKDYQCEKCSGAIFAGTYYERRLRRVSGEMVSAKAHLICPVMPEIGSPEYADLAKRASESARKRLGLHPDDPAWAVPAMTAARALQAVATIVFAALAFGSLWAVGFTLGWFH
jgi:hypothetical protein